MATIGPEWVSASRTRNYCERDPLLGWLNLYGESKGFVPDHKLPGYESGPASSRSSSRRARRSRLPSWDTSRRGFQASPRWPPAQPISSTAPRRKRHLRLAGPVAG